MAAVWQTRGILVKSPFQDNLAGVVTSLLEFVSELTLQGNFPQVPPSQTQCAFLRLSKTLFITGSDKRWHGTKTRGHGFFLSLAVFAIPSLPGTWQSRASFLSQETSPSQCCLEGLGTGILCRWSVRVCSIK